MDKGKRAEDSEVVVVVRSRRLKVKIKELFNLERNGASTRERKVVGMRRARDILQSPSGPDRGESHEIRTQRICYHYTTFRGDSISQLTEPTTMTGQMTLWLTVREYENVIGSNRKQLTAVSLSYVIPRLD